MIVFALFGTPESWAPARALERFRYAEVHMGLPVAITVYAPDRGTAEAGAGAAFARIAALDAVLSDYRIDSELNRLSATSGAYVPVSDDLWRVLARALEIARTSDGAFDPTVGPLTALWREARRTRRLPPPAALASARARVGWRLVTLAPERRAVRLERDGMRLDLGGIAKGYVLQEALAVLDARGLPIALLEAGGDIIAGDAPPGRTGWTIAVPGADAAFAARAAALRRAALATSGPAAQFVEIDGARYSHVIDPRTGFGLTAAHEAHIIAADGATADALATAIGVVGPHDAASWLGAFARVEVHVTRSR